MTTARPSAESFAVARSNANSLASCRSVVKFAAAAVAENAPTKGSDADEGSNDVHRNMSNTRNLNAAASQNVSVNANWNVDISGGCCYRRLQHRS